MGSVGAFAAIAKTTKRDVFPFDSASASASSPSHELPNSLSLPDDYCSRSFANWPTGPKPTGCPPITLIFEGLMGFFYDRDKNQTQVGFHPGDGMHKPEILLWEKSGADCSQSLGSCRKVLALTPIPEAVTHLNLRVIEKNGSERPAGVDFYKEGECLNRLNGPVEDFRWLNDLDEYYRDPDGKPYRRRKKFKPVLYVNNGTFYTRMITKKIFQRIDSKKHLSEQTGTSIGRTALVMAAEVNLDEGEYVVLDLTNEKNETVGQINIVQKPNTFFELDFSSRCDKKDCKPVPCHDSDEKKRNDFYFMRKVLDLPGGLPKYSIALAAAADPTTCGSVETLTERRGDYCGASYIEVTDEAPCAGAGYSGGGCDC
jgi:hypothetical protein